MENPGTGQKQPFAGIAGIPLGDQGGIMPAGTPLGGANIIPTPDNIVDTIPAALPATHSPTALTASTASTASTVSLIDPDDGDWLSLA